MKTLDNILNLIKSENIILEEYKNLKINKGVYLNIPTLFNNPIIGVSPNLINYHKEFNSILAEELGHHFTTYGNLIKNPKNYYEEVQNSKKEMAARRWAANYMISNSDFIKALNDCIYNIYNMSEYFDITEELIKYKVKSITLDENLYMDIKSKFKLNEVPYMCCNI